MIYMNTIILVIYTYFYYMFCTFQRCVNILLLGKVSSLQNFFTMCITWVTSPPKALQGVTALPFPSLQFPIMSSPLFAHTSGALGLILMWSFHLSSVFLLFFQASLILLINHPHQSSSSIILINHPHRPGLASNVQKGHRQNIQWDKQSITLVTLWLW